MWQEIYAKNYSDCYLFGRVQARKRKTLKKRSLSKEKRKGEVIMEKSLFEQMGGTYSEVGDYMLPNLSLPAEKQLPIGLWGQRHARYLKEHHKVMYMNLLTGGKLNSYLAEIDKSASEMMERLVKDMAQKQGITEKLKEENPMKWVGLMNNIRSSAQGIVFNDIIYT